ncbi:hypothetical protein [Mesorhizobium sp. 131-3-5]|uniref:hypothetical protein n=1 Tax=Mesorhizobium sp. 131-3-5 TaxID=2744520 RepID=UPI001926CC7B|nr:hypothetical protein [Mesorhizobium sp. 131-3-5]
MLDLASTMQSSAMPAGSSSGIVQDLDVLALFRGNRIENGHSHSFFSKGETKDAFPR